MDEGLPEGSPAWETDCPAHLRLAQLGSHKGRIREVALRKQGPRASQRSPSLVSLAGAVVSQQPQSHAGQQGPRARDGAEFWRAPMITRQPKLWGGDEYTQESGTPPAPPCPSLQEKGGKH